MKGQIGFIKPGLLINSDTGEMKLHPGDDTSPLINRPYIPKLLYDCGQDVDKCKTAIEKEGGTYDTNKDVFENVYKFYSGKVTLPTLPYFKEKSNYDPGYFVNRMDRHVQPYYNNQMKELCKTTQHPMCKDTIAITASKFDDTFSFIKEGYISPYQLPNEKYFYYKTIKDCINGSDPNCSISNTKINVIEANYYNNLIPRHFVSPEIEELQTDSPFFKNSYLPLSFGTIVKKIHGISIIIRFNFRVQNERLNEESKQSIKEKLSEIGIPDDDIQFIMNYEQQLLEKSMKGESVGEMINRFQTISKSVIDIFKNKDDLLITSDSEPKLNHIYFDEPYSLFIGIFLNGMINTEITNKEGKNIKGSYVINFWDSPSGEGIDINKIFSIEKTDGKKFYGYYLTTLDDQGLKTFKETGNKQFIASKIDIENLELLKILPKATYNLNG